MARVKSQEKYEAIMTSTLRLATQHGLQWLSMSKIAKDAGVVPATIYVYFENTVDLLNQLYLDSKKRISGDLDHIIDPEKSYHENFRVVWESIYDHHVNNPQDFQFIEQCSASPLVTPETKTKGLEMFGSLINYIRKGVSEGVIKDMPIELLHALFYSPIVSLVKEELFHKLQISASDKKAVFESTWRAVREA